jgi:hypothetical protein
MSSATLMQTTRERFQAKNFIMLSLHLDSTSALSSWVSWRGNMVGHPYIALRVNFADLVLPLPDRAVLSAPDKSGTQPTSAPAHGGYGFRPPQEAGITFDRFVRCCVVVRQLTESFQRRVSFSIQEALYAHAFTFLGWTLNEVGGSRSTTRPLCTLFSPHLKEAYCVISTNIWFWKTRLGIECI